ncbi:abscisic acid receptor PYL8-like [Curcuma longa]|uniref:abscisic acid receptor PYL8-like n=1 Tax=Curcuma longa TaxID=136217 RepID=UPI003D9F9783
MPQTGKNINHEGFHPASLVHYRVDKTINTAFRTQERRGSLDCTHLKGRKKETEVGGCLGSVTEEVAELEKSLKAEDDGWRWPCDRTSGGSQTMEEEYVQTYHRHEPRDNQCSSTLVKHIRAPVHLVWSLVRRFDQPQKYKPFVSRCVVQGDLEIGSVREVNVKSGLPATTSTERLELLDDNEHVLSVKIVGGDHRLKNYCSIITVHPVVIDGRPGTLVIESFVVDVPDGNTKDETCYFVEALINCNLKSLTDVCERLVAQPNV